MKILIAEDELDMQKILRLYLEKEGYTVALAADGREAFELLCAEPFDLLIADWMMPRMDGAALCREVRKYELPIKIIMLTAKSEAQNEFDGLSYGADDYIRKPFDTKVLLLRIKKMLQLDGLLRCGELTLNPQTQGVFAGRDEIRLTQKEFLLLQVLLLNKDITLSRETLLDRVWGSDYDGDERTLDTHIRRLRGKLVKPYITTYVGVGYRMEDVHE